MNKVLIGVIVVVVLVVAWVVSRKFTPTVATPPTQTTQPATTQPVIVPPVIVSPTPQPAVVPVTTQPVTTQPVTTQPVVTPVVTPPVNTPPTSWINQTFGFRSKSNNTLMIRPEKGVVADGAAYNMFDNCGNVNYKSACLVSPIEVKPGVVMIRDNRNKSYGYRVDVAGADAPLKLGKCSSTNTLCQWKVTNTATDFILSPVEDPTLALTLVGGATSHPKLRPLSNTPAQLWTRSYVTHNI